MSEGGDYTQAPEPHWERPASRPRRGRSPRGPLLVVGAVAVVLLLAGFVVGVASSGSDAPKSQGTVTLDHTVKQVTVTQTVAKVTVIVTG